MINGSRIFENTEVVQLKYEDDEVKAITKYGYVVTGKIAIVATGYNTKLFTNRTFGTKSTTFNIVTKPVKSFEGWSNKVLIIDNIINEYGNECDYEVRDTLLYTGKKLEYEEIKNEYAILEQRLKKMFPFIENIEAQYKYCGAFASTNDNLGFLGKDPEKPQLWYCLGYGANGILFAILGGVMLSELYCGNYNEDLELFRVDRFN